MEEHVTTILQSLLPTSRSFLAWFTPQPRRRGRHFPLKHLLDYNGLNSILPLKMNSSSPKFCKFITYSHKTDHLMRHLNPNFKYSKFFHFQVGEMLWNMVYALM
jgi:hypothetical protein